jgi:acyl carrier protein
MEHQDFLIELAKTIEVDPAALTPEFSIKYGSTWDSLAFISTIALVDKHFGIILDSDALAEINTLKELIQLYSAKVM